jgi:hypothetical protein
MMKTNCRECKATNFYLKSLNSRKTLILNKVAVEKNEDPTLEEIYCCEKSKKVDHPLGFHCRKCHRTYCVFCNHFKNEKDKYCCVYKCWIRCGCKSCR